MSSCLLDDPGLANPSRQACPRVRRSDQPMGLAAAMTQRVSVTSDSAESKAAFTQLWNTGPDNTTGRVEDWTSVHTSAESSALGSRPTAAVMRPTASAALQP